jgi:hypothetical protein
MHLIRSQLIIIIRSGFDIDSDDITSHQQTYYIPLPPPPPNTGQ